MPYSALRAWGRARTSLVALIVLLAVAALLLAIPRVILPWAQSSASPHFDPALWGDFAAPYDAAAAVVAVSAILIFLVRRR
ncbi:hypothetical protein [Ralstonia solanacearum]|uniref:hypothetical protein n=1 Tax=Ralstonia solanacearum TaxID=305 RepID=UPI0012A09C5B|nr:hypothetical protein [Ralstonia solanacearum]AYB60570.1 hypothetical protein C2124_08235 [Ralstonia solanacearum]